MVVGGSPPVRVGRRWAMKVTLALGRVFFCVLVKKAPKKRTLLAIEPVVLGSKVNSSGTGRASYMILYDTKQLSFNYSDSSFKKSNKLNLLFAWNGSVKIEEKKVLREEYLDEISYEKRSFSR